MTAAPVDRVRARLGREWTITVEVVTPPPDDAASRSRVLTLADALRDDARVAALTLTDRTASLAADPVAFAPDVIARIGSSPLVHIAGKARDLRGLEDALRACEGAGVGSVLLTGGDPVKGATALDAVDMLRTAADVAPALTRLAVATLPRSVRGVVSRERVAAKRESGADAFVAQVSWDLAEREIVAEWQARLGAPILGAVMWLTAGRLEFLAAHRITGIVVPPALRARISTGSRSDAVHRLALDLVLLQRLGYAGAHVSGILTPALLTSILDEAARLDAALDDDWRRVWREAMSLA